MIQISLVHVGLYSTNHLLRLPFLIMGKGYADLYHLRIWTIEFKRMTNGVRCSSSSVMVSESDSACVQRQRIEN